MLHTAQPVCFEYAISLVHSCHIIVKSIPYSVTGCLQIVNGKFSEVFSCFRQNYYSIVFGFDIWVNVMVIDFHHSGFLSYSDKAKQQMTSHFPEFVVGGSPVQRLDQEEG